MVTRTPWLDWYADGSGESAVLVGERVVVLSELATALVDAVGEGAAVQALTTALVGGFGAPPGDDPAAATMAAVRVLVEGGVLTAAEGGR